MSKDVALVVIDVQRGMFDNPPARGDEVLATISELIARARAAAVPVVYVQHRGGRSGHRLHPDTTGFLIHPAIAPTDSEPVIQKNDCDAFQNTSLQATLDVLGAKHLVVAGLQTEYCVDTTCRRAYSLGYDVTLVQDGHSTWDTPTLPADKIVAHHNAVLGHSFATLKPAAEAL